MGSARKIDKKEFEETIKLFISGDNIIDDDELANVLQIADKQHIATTDVNKSLATKIRKYKRVKQTIKLFLEHGGLISDIELANILKAEGIDTSSSTVGRDLTGDMAKEILTEEQYNNIVLLRASNLLKGKQKGGQNYALNNTYQKDEHGKFTGSKRNGR